MLTALCMALPAQVGLIVRGGEGALIIGGVAPVAMAAVLPGVPPPAVVAAMLLAGMGAGGLRIPPAGRPGRHHRVHPRLLRRLPHNLLAGPTHHPAAGPPRARPILRRPASPPRWGPDKTA